jgi:hypothetical protein
MDEEGRKEGREEGREGRKGLVVRDAQYPELRKKPRRGMKVLEILVCVLLSCTVLTQTTASRSLNGPREILQTSLSLLDS